MGLGPIKEQGLDFAFGDVLRIDPGFQNDLVPGAHGGNAVSQVADHFWADEGSNDDLAGGEPAIFIQHARGMAAALDPLRHRGPVLRGVVHHFQADAGSGVFTRISSDFFSDHSNLSISSNRHQRGHLHLGPVQLGVNAVRLVHQIRMKALLDDFSLVQHD
jgi:hypothetical protein